MHTGAPGADKVRKRTRHSQILVFSQCFFTRLRRPQLSERRYLHGSDRSASWFGSAPPARTRTATARRSCATCATNHGHLPGRQRGPARLSNLLSRCRRRRRRNRTCCTNCIPPSPGLMWTRHAVSSLGWELCCPRMIHRQLLMLACRWVILGHYCVPPLSCVADGEAFARCRRRGRHNRTCCTNWFQPSPGLI